MRRALCIFAFLILGNLTGLHAETSLDTVRALELRSFDDIMGTNRSASELLLTINRRETPGLWLRVWLLSLGDQAGDAIFRELDQSLTLAQNLDLRAERILLLLKKAELHQSDWAKENVLSLYEEAKTLSFNHADPELYPRVLYEEAYYHYLTDAFPAGLQSIKEAVRLSEGFQGERRIFHYEYRSVLAALLLATQETTKALEIYEENLAWANAHHFRSSAGTYAYNAAMVLVNAKSGDADKALSYFEIAAGHARSLGDPLKEANALAGKAQYLFNRQDYQPAKNLLKRALELFRALKNPYRLYSTLVFLARCSLELGHLQDAERYAAEAAPIIKTEFQQDKMHLYLVQYRLAKRAGNWARALESMEKFHDAYEQIKESQEQSQLQRLKTELGLLLEEERSAKLKEHLAAEETRNELLRKENEAQARELELTERLRLIALILFVLLGITATTLSLAIRRGRAVIRARAKTQAILDTIDEGLVTLDEQLCVMDGYSAYTRRIFSKDAGIGSDIFTALLNRADVTTETLSLWKEALQAGMGADAIAWELNEGHLPRELILRDESMVLSLFWQPMLRDGHIVSYILAFRDVSAVKAMEKTITAERQQREKIQSHITEILSRNVKESRRLIQSLGMQLPGWDASLQADSERAPILRQLHTYKGTARSLGLQTLSGVIHNVEDALRGEREGRGALRPLMQEQSLYQSVFDEVLSVTDSALTLGPRSLLSVVDELVPDVALRLQEKGLVLKEIAVADAVFVWPEQLLRDMQGVLMHAFSNAVDHGFLRPLAKGVVLDEALFKVRAWCVGASLHVQILDNGIGLDWKALADLARSRGFHPQGEQTLADVLLLDGVSTAADVTETSGRGVGLAAVRATCEDWQGALKIQDNPEGRGSMLALCLQMKSVTEDR